MKLKAKAKEHKDTALQLRPREGRGRRVGTHGEASEFTESVLGFRFQGSGFRVYGFRVLGF